MIGLHKKIYMSLLIIVLVTGLFASVNDKYKFGLQMFKDALYEEAILEFEKIIEEAPTSTEAQQSLFYIGESYRLREDFVKAEIYYKKLLDGYPSNSGRDRTLFYYGNVLSAQKKYSTAQGVYSELVEKYPMSEFTKKSLLFLLESFYYDEKYNEVILMSLDLEKNYADNKAIADVLLMKAKAYFMNNSPNEGQATLENLIKSHKNSDTHWDAILFQVQRIKVKSGNVAAADKLSSYMSGSIPRKYQEIFGKELADLYIEIHEYDKAHTQLMAMITKFDNSDRFPEYLRNLFLVKNNLKKYQEVVTLAGKTDKIIEHSKLKTELLLELAKAEFNLKKFKDAENTIVEIIASEPNEAVLIETKLLSAEIDEGKRFLNKAIDKYLALLNKDNFDRKDKVIYTIANIYFNDLSQYRTALKYYQLISTNYSSSQYNASAYFQIALCYEYLGEYDLALASLQSIPMETVNDKQFREKVSNKMEYIRNFHIVDYKKAFTKLLISMNDYVTTNDKIALKKGMAEVMSQHLKDFDSAVSITDGESDEQLFYVTAKTFLKAAEKAKWEKNQKVFAENVAGALAQINKMKESAETTELNLYADLLRADNPAMVIPSIEQFVKNNPDYSRVNNYLYRLIRYYDSSDNIEKEAEYLNLLKQDDSIADADYMNAKIKLAEYYYGKNDFANALVNYEATSALISLSRPSVLYHYTIALNKAGNKTKSMDKLVFLLNNAGGFPEYSEAVNTLTGYYIESSEFKKALNYYQQIPENERNDAYYRRLYTIYSGLNNIEESKRALLTVQDKNFDELASVAELHIKTHDYSLAEYTYKQLIEKDPGNKFAYRLAIANLAYDQEDYSKSIEYFKKVTNEYIMGQANKKELAKKNIISYYHIDNRPKAEEILKKMKPIIGEDPDIQAEIKIHEAIYYSKIDIKKARKIVGKVIKNKKIAGTIVNTAHFWRGTFLLKEKNSEDAIKDFSVVLNSSNKALVNQANLKLGTLYFSQEKYEQALDHYFKVINGDETGKLALDAARNFAFVCKTIEEWDKAISAYELIMDKWGDKELESDAVFNIAYCYYRDKSYPKAVSMFEKALQLIDSEELKAESQYWIGESYMGMYMYNEAVTAFLKVSYNYPDQTRWSATSELQAAEAYIKLKKYERALTRLKSIIAKYGAGSNWGKIAQEKISIIQ